MNIIARMGDRAAVISFILRDLSGVPIVGKTFNPVDVLIAYAGTGPWSIARGHVSEFGDDSGLYSYHLARNETAEPGYRWLRVQVPGATALVIGFHVVRDPDAPIYFTTNPCVHDLIVWQGDTDTQENYARAGTCRKCGDRVSG